MAKEEVSDLLKFLAPFPESVRGMALWLRDFVWERYPQANELIYDNYNAVAFGWSVTDRLGHTFCTVAVMRANYNIHFGFYWGSEIADPEKRLLGNGNQYRYLLVKDQKEFPKAYVTKLVKEAYANSLGKVKDRSLLQKGKTLVKSVSPKQRKPGLKTLKRDKPKGNN